MNTKLLIITIIIILLAAFVLYGVRLDVDQASQPQIEVQEEITSTQATYLSEDGGEVLVTYYSDDTATFNIPGTEYNNIQVTRAISASGARYENTELGLVVWEKAADLTITKDDETIFEGKKFEQIQTETLTTGTWIWQKTYEGTGPEADMENATTPNNADAFTLTFSTDGQLSGTTDCNTFGGTYRFEDGQIQFGNFMSTLMFCEDSREQEFISMIKDGQLSMSGDELYLEHEQTIIFKKQADNI